MTFDATRKTAKPEEAANPARLMMLEAHCRQLSERVRALTAENEEMQIRRELAECSPFASIDGNAIHLAWLRVVRLVWGSRVKAIGERNQARAEVERLTVTVRRLEEEARQREATYQAQVADLLTK
jgi:hypothetical protein